MLALPAALYAQVKDGVPPAKHRWTKFVTVAGQPEPVPAEWVATPEGQFAHSIVIPNPVPKDSGYHWWWSAKKYFLHLCEKEAGEFVFKTVENVEGFLLMRPPDRPTDFDLRDLYKLEAPSFERTFRAYKDDIRGRGLAFVSPGREYGYLEEPNPDRNDGKRKFLTATEFNEKSLSLERVVAHEAIESQYAVIWRGIRREKDRDNGIAGTEVIILDLTKNDVIGVLREFGWTGRNAWWLNAAVCPQFYSKYPRPEVQQKYGFISSVLHPPAKSASR